MSKAKESEFAIQQEGKESFSERLRLLIGHRSVRAVSRLWGLSFSTLNNYLNKGTDPSFSAVRAIARAENVSIDWLAFGDGGNKVDDVTRGVVDKVDAFDPNGKLSIAWLMVLESIEPAEVLSLMKLIHRKGVERLINDGKHLTDIENSLLGLPEEEKERLMALHEAKKGASEGSELEIAQSLVSERKQAG